LPLGMTQHRRLATEGWQKFKTCLKNLQRNRKKYSFTAESAFVPLKALL
jgi:hypothetical protein